MQKPNLEFENTCGFPVKKIAGVDEVGRGCIAGPVVAATVLLPQEKKLWNEPWIEWIHDSKKLSAQKREELYPLIQNWALDYSIQWASIEEIDTINIFHASHLAMIRSMESIKKKTDFFLVDGKFLPISNLPMKAVIKGDLKCISIACASILAKVYRDRLMVKLEKDCPGYGFAQHKGYPTKIHLNALKLKGISEFHRKSFAPVAKYVLE